MNKRERGTPRASLWSWAGVIAPPLALALAFAYVAGWLTPQRLTSARIVDAFEKNPGSYPGYRRNHAKGVCVDGYFQSSGAGAAWIRAPLFAAGRVPVIGRFSMPGSNPVATDGMAAVRSLALWFKPQRGGEWRTAMNSVPVFTVRTPQDLMAQLRAFRPDPKTGKVSMASVDAFFAAHPETATMRHWLESHAPSSSYGNGTYYSVNAFRIDNLAGISHMVRWRMAPEQPYAAAPAGESGGDDFLEQDLASRLGQGPLRWKLIFTVAAPGDTTDDATVRWPDHGRQQFDAGTLVIEHATRQIYGACRDVVFDPLILPEGMAPSGDPLLPARSSVYARSFERRLREEAGRSATTPD